MPPEAHDTVNRIVLLALLALSLLMVGSESYLRLSGDGLGCEPWPHCYGSEEAAAQARHSAGAAALRAIGAVAPAGVAAIVLGWLMWGWQKLARGERASAGLLLLTTAVFASSARSGAVAIPWQALLHVLAGLAVVALTMALLLRASEPQALPCSRQRALAAAAVLVLLQVSTGVLISVRGAGAACAVACTYLWVPGLAAALDPFTPGSAIDLARNTAAGQPLQAWHRLGGMLVAMAAVAAGLLAVGGRAGLRIVVLAATTALLGFVVAANDGPVIAVVAHTLSAAGLLGLMVAVLLTRARSQR
ncbi:MAG: hypothetical protein RMK97_03850 [Sutterellaceae bacterium]|nr:hypothetical protein [Burkholderiaceae bacterium]MDW8429624.1 hypothetical protein [Sutterellaceae bacterium]